MSISVIISLAIALILSIVGLVLCKHYTRLFGIPVLLILQLINLLVFRSDNGWIFTLQIIVSIVCFTLYCIVASKIKYDFTNKILSWRMIINSFKPADPKSRTIGKVLPYNNYQLRYNGKYIEANEISTAGATMISGSIGSGKTYGMVSLIKQDISNDKSVIFSEYKGDPKTVNEIIDFAKSYGYKIFVINPKTATADFNYDPLRNINNAGRIEAIINMRKWSMDGADAHYRTSVQLLLQKTIGDFTHIYNNEVSKNPSANLSYTVGFYNYLKQYHAAREEWDAYSTISKLLELLLTSTLKPMFGYEYPSDRNLSFADIKNEKFVVITSFISSNKELATSFTSLMLKDLLDTFTVEQPLRNVSLYIDEFATLENPFIIKDTLEKGRSAKIATTLALQDINQIVIQTNEAYLNSILGIINTFIIYSGATRTTAEKFAGVQLLEIEPVLMNLRKPLNGKSPTAIYISKYPTLNRKTNSEVFRFEPYIFKKGLNSNNIEESKTKFVARFDEDDSADNKNEGNDSNLQQENQPIVDYTQASKEPEVSKPTSDISENNYSYEDFI